MSFDCLAFNVRRTHGHLHVSFKLAVAWHSSLPSQLDRNVRQRNVQ